MKHSPPPSSLCDVHRRAFNRRLLALPAMGLLAAGSAPHVRAAPGGLPNAAHGDSSPQWENLRKRLFADRPIQTDGVRSAVQLHAPLRAAYGASVPIKVTARLPQRPDLYVRRVHLLVDKNPSPVSIALDLTPAIGQADFETRLRVDEYSHVRVVAELSNGELHADSRYVKTSGGCSAPPNRDAPELIGRTQISVPEGLHPGRPTAAQVTVLHPNDTGFELNNQTVMFIPPWFVRSIRLRYGSQPLFEADMDFSVSENPTLRFHFVPGAQPAELLAEVEDTKDLRYQGRLLVGAA